MRLDYGLIRIEALMMILSHQSLRYLIGLRPGIQLRGGSRCLLIAHAVLACLIKSLIYQHFFQLVSSLRRAYTIPPQILKSPLVLYDFLRLTYQLL